MFHETTTEASPSKPVPVALTTSLKEPLGSLRARLAVTWKDAAAVLTESLAWTDWEPAVLAGVAKAQEKPPVSLAVNWPDRHVVIGVELKRSVTGPDGVKPEPVAVVDVPTVPRVTLRLRNGGPITKEAEGAEFTLSEALTRYVPAARVGTANEQLRSPKAFALVDPAEQREIVVVPNVIESAAPVANPRPMAVTFEPTFPLAGVSERVGRLSE